MNHEWAQDMSEAIVAMTATLNKIASNQNNLNMRLTGLEKLTVQDLIDRVNALEALSSKYHQDDENHLTLRQELIAIRADVKSLRGRVIALESHQDPLAYNKMQEIPTTDGVKSFTNVEDLMASLDSDDDLSEEKCSGCGFIYCECDEQERVT